MAVEIGSHGADGFAVFVTANARHQWRVRHAQSQHKAPGGQFGDGLVNGIHRHRVARVDIGNTGGENQLLGVGGHKTDDGEGVAAHCLRYPESGVTPLLQLLCELHGLGCRHIVDKGPDAQFAEFGGHGVPSCT